MAPPISTINFCYSNNHIGHETQDLYRSDPILVQYLLVWQSVMCLRQTGFRARAERPVHYSEFVPEMTNAGLIRHQGVGQQPEVGKVSYRLVSVPTRVSASHLGEVNGSGLFR